MGKVLDKFLGVIGVEVEDEETDENNMQWSETEKVRKTKKNNLLGLPSQRPVTMMLLKVKSYDEIESIGQHIKERRSVIVSLDDVEKETAQRIVDFLSGAVFALEGTVQKVSSSTFLFATSNVDVVGQISDEERGKMFFNSICRGKK